MFSFNSPYGACPTCNGLGKIQEFTVESVIPDDNLSISRGGIAPLGEYRDIWVFKQIEAILKAEKLSLTTPIKKIPEKVLKELLYGSERTFRIFSSKYSRTYDSKFEGLGSLFSPYADRRYR